MFADLAADSTRREVERERPVDEVFAAWSARPAYRPGVATAGVVRRVAERAAGDEAIELSLGDDLGVKWREF